MKKQPFLTPPVLAEIWGVNADRVLALIRDGKLKAYNFGRKTRPRYRIDPKDAEAFLQTLAVDSAEQPARPRRRRFSDVQEFV